MFMLSSFHVNMDLPSVVTFDVSGKASGCICIVNVQQNNACIHAYKIQSSGFHSDSLPELHIGKVMHVTLER